MAILPKSQKEESRIEIDLTGPDGNAFALMGIAKNLAKQLKLDGEMITKEMMLGDYEDLLNTMERYFGDHIIMYR
jgi:hypothetical protein